jgi:3-methylfumaryl-CoA hydratase
MFHFTYCFCWVTIPEVDRRRSSMTTPDSGDVLAAARRDRRPPTVETVRRVDPWQSAASAVLLDAPVPADELPRLRHWFRLLDHPAPAEIGEDGHPVAGPFLPPIPGRRRTSPSLTASIRLA